MTDYDFSTLHDKEFESLCIDLLSAEFGKQFTRFKSGRDSGIDGRFFTSDGSTEIIQCKHYLKSGFNTLLQTLKNTEQPKVNKISPQKYYVVTSVPLNPANKTKIRALFTNYMPNDDYIIGQEQLNILLDKHPNLERNYYKLWLSSINVLNTILNNAIIGRSDSFLGKIRAKSNLYVFSDIVSKAAKILKEKNTVIIEGEPGIGKSTLAEMLILIVIKNNYKVYKIENSINEAEEILSPSEEEKQLFYFDDFLGSNYLTAIENHKDSHIVNFIERISRTKNKKFILTSRTNIIQRAKSLSDTFNNAKTKQNEYILKVTDLSKINKAGILYNHIWHSNLPADYIDQLYEDKRYLKIIQHKNFNPRIIEFITDVDRLSEVSPSQYWADIEKKLNNPAEIWANTFDNQSNDYVRALVLLVVFSNGKITEQKLIEAYNNISKTITKTETQNTDFASSVKIAVNYFINRSTESSTEETSYSLFNPSITDFILIRYYNNSETIYNILNSLRTAESVDFVYGAGITSKLGKNIVESALITLFSNCKSDLNIYVDSAFIIKLIDKISLQINGYDEIGNILIDIFTHKLNLPDTVIKELIRILNFLFSKIEGNITVDKDEIITYILEQINQENKTNLTFDSEDINEFIKLVNAFEIKNSNIIELINEFLNNEFLPFYLEKIVNEQISINDIELEEDELEVNKDSIWLCINEIQKLILDEIGDFAGIDINEDDFVSAIDIESINDMLVKQYCQYDEDREYDFSSNDQIKDIDQLFERNK